MSDAIQALLLSGELDDDQKAKLTQVNIGYSAFITQLQAANTLRRLQWLAGATQKLGGLEEKMFDPDKLNTYGFRQRLKLMEYLQRNTANVNKEVYREKALAARKGDSERESNFAKLLEAVMNGSIQLVASSVPETERVKVIAEKPAQVRGGLLHNVDKLLGPEPIRTTPPP